MSFLARNKQIIMTVPEIMTQLQSHGSESIKKILLKHGVKEPFFGVKIEHLKTIQKKVKTDYRLALDLYATGNADAMYLAGLIAPDDKMTKADLQTWVEQAVSNNISEYTVPWVASGSNYGFELATEWINSPEEHIAAAGWSTLSNLVALKPDAELNIPSLRLLLVKVAKTIHQADNRVRYTMNGFVISAGTYVTALTKDAIATAEQIGGVTVDMNGTACKVPDAAGYIIKIQNMGTPVKKKKKVKC
ncbi:MAG: 3-methyladenine glycosylase AlkD [Mucilaginibacter sp.]|nr:3-methyladenine glycosylase AlkD [Mucilaginibacter sp.]